MEEKEFIKSKPKVELLAFTKQPLGMAAASARTCYSDKLITVAELKKGQEKRLGKMIYDGGHHTPFQHPVFVFGLSGISRQFVWSFLHSHPFYNSDQSSQRYNVLKNPVAFMPELNDEQTKIYQEAVLKAWNAYEKVSEILFEENKELMNRIGKIKGLNEKRIESEGRKKAAENARYLLPICAETTLWHTVSGLTLARYARMINSNDTPEESKIVVEQMLKLVKKEAPEFFELIEKELNEKELPENNLKGNSKEFIKEFDSMLEEKQVKLISWTENGEKLIAESVREVVGLSKGELTEKDAIDLVLNPAKNKLLLEPLNTWTHNPLMRSLNHINYVFKKKISHAGDSQDQRHRTVPASRPLLSKTHTKEPDYYVPEIMKKSEKIMKITKETMELLWEAKNKLIKLGVDEHNAVYLLPNAVNLRFTETGSLLNLLHKWRMRLCLNAQLEIWEHSMEEIKQVKEKHPELIKFIGPACFTRKGLVEENGKQGPCPEPSWCGITTWINFPKVRRIF